MPKVVITMPAYRAEKTLEKTVVDIPAGVADELLLVDDASPDDTAAIARSLGIRVHVHPVNRGYGGNQKTCYTEALKSGADVIVLLHPDYQYDPKAVPLLIAPILAGDADMTFGSRFAGLGDPRSGGMPMYRFVGNRLTTMAENLLLGSRFTETHSGMRAYTRNCLLSLPFLSYTDDFAFDSQFLVDAITTGLRLVEIPIPTRYTEESSSIAVARSMKYVAQSLWYCARRVRERGRRGRRSPAILARRTDAPAVQWQEAPADRRAELLDWARRVAAGYATPGDHVIEVRAGITHLDVGADTVLLVAGDGELSQELGRAHELLVDERGLLALLLLDGSMDASRAACSIGGTLRDTGFRLLDCVTSTVRSRRRSSITMGAVAVARPAPRR
jgi:hypothetical protein